MLRFLSSILLCIALCTAPLVVSAAGLRSSVAERRAQRLKHATHVSVPPRRGPSLAQVTDLRAEVVALVNRERAAHGLSALRPSAQLQTSAQSYAQTLAARGVLSHVVDGQNLSDRIRDVGYLQTPCQGCSWSFAMGENLARGQKTPAEVVRDWMASPGHRDNILDPTYSEIGIGMQGTVWVQHFGAVTTVSQR